MNIMLLAIQGSEEVGLQKPLLPNSQSSLKPLSLVQEKESYQLAKQLYQLLVISSSYYLCYYVVYDIPSQSNCSPA